MEVPPVKYGSSTEGSKLGRGLERVFWAEEGVHMAEGWERAAWQSWGLGPMDRPGHGEFSSRLDQEETLGQLPA